MDEDIEDDVEGDFGRYNDLFNLLYRLLTPPTGGDIFLGGGLI